MKAAIKLAKRASWIGKSWTMYAAALLMAAPDILAFLPTVKEHMTPTMYEWLFRAAGVLFILLRIKTQIAK